WTLLTSTTPSYYQARLVYTNPELPALDTQVPETYTDFPGVRGDIRARTIGLVLTRTVDEGIAEELVLSNFTGTDMCFHLELALRSDFVDLFDVKAHRYFARGESETNWQQAFDGWEMVTRYKNRDFERRFTYRVLASDSSARYDNGRIAWTVALPAGGLWR